MHKEFRTINRFRFTQAMDTKTDSAYYHDLEGQLLMKVDSSGVAFDAQDKVIGTFTLRYKEQTWAYESSDGKVVIETPYHLLFDQVEPFVVEKLFNKEGA